jgi:hypothetical protein
VGSVSATDNAEDDGGRDPQTGRFRPGNAFGKGNRLNSRLAAIRSELVASAAPRLAAVVAALADKAEAGDVQAAKVLFERLLGASRQEPEEPAELDVGPLVTLEAVAAATGHVVRQAAAGELGREQAEVLLHALAEHRQSLEAVRMAELEQRLANLEQLQGFTDAQA